MSKVYTGSGRLFQEVQALGLDDEALLDIERRVKVQPHFLGEPLVVIAEARDFPQIVSPDSHDIVALDSMGRAVAISLKVEVADAGDDIHALQLAAHIGTLHPEELGKIARSFIMRPANDNIRRAWEDMGVEMGEESVELTSLLAANFERDAEDYATMINSSQRVILAAEGFTSRLVSVIEWLENSGVNIIGIRYRKYLVGGQEVYFAEQVVPRLDPAVDTPDSRKAGKHSAEVAEPWKTKGRIYHAERLTPALANRLNEFIVLTKESTFAINWSNKYYFWLRGGKRNLRVRTYFRDKMELGFYNITPSALTEFLAKYKLEGLEISVVGGYTDSPFLAVTSEMEFTPEWTRMLNAWLSGA
jgi:hypothetical protein